MKQKVLLLLPAASYRNDAFRAAAARLGVEISAAADYCHRLAPAWGLHPLLALPFDRPSRAAALALKHLEARPDAVLAVDDHGVELAALLARKLGLQGNSVRSVRLLRDKFAWRSLLERSGMPHPWFRHLSSDADPTRLRALRLPAVVKARRLAASRGVIRADTRAALVRAVAQVRRIQHKADRDAARLGLVIEGFIPGREYALEGLMVKGNLRVLALFDKPDPLDGPYFEETIFVTPRSCRRACSAPPRAKSSAPAATPALPTGRCTPSSASTTAASGCSRSRRARSAACAGRCSRMRSA